MSFNKIIIVGNLGRDPELRYTAQGTLVCTFSWLRMKIAKINGEMQDHTIWFRVTLFNRMAENASQYLHKGKQVYIEGRLRVEEYVIETANHAFNWKCTATDMHFIGPGATTRARGTRGFGSRLSSPGATGLIGRRYSILR